jgi:hypothetical protein
MTDIASLSGAKLLKVETGATPVLRHDTFQICLALAGVFWNNTSP